MYKFLNISFSSLIAQLVKNLPAMQETPIWFLSQEDSLEESMATHSSTFVWRIPWTEEPGGLHSIGSHRVRRDWSYFSTGAHKHLQTLSQRIVSQFVSCTSGVIECSRTIWMDLLIEPQGTTLCRRINKAPTFSRSIFPCLVKEP